MLRRCAANNTHLYPGAVLRNLDDIRSMPATGDRLLIEFSDGVLVHGDVIQAGTDAVVLRVPAYRTRRGADVAARTWRLAPGDGPRQLRVRQRLPAA